MRSSGAVSSNAEANDNERRCEELDTSMDREPAESPKEATNEDGDGREEDEGEGSRDSLERDESAESQAAPGKEERTVCDEKHVPAAPCGAWCGNDGSVRRRLTSCSSVHRRQRDRRTQVEGSR